MKHYVQMNELNSVAGNASHCALTDNCCFVSVVIPPPTVVAGGIIFYC